MEWLSLFVGHSDDGLNVVQFDPNTVQRRLLYCNDRYVEMSGRSRDELFAEADLNRLVVPHRTPGQLEEDYAAITSGRNIHGQASWLRPDGRENVFEYSGWSIHKDGRVYVVGIDRDITERKRLEADFQATLRQYQFLADNITDIIYTMDSSWKVTYVSPSVQRISGYSIQELLETPFDQFVAPASQELFWRIVRQGVEHLEEFLTPDGALTLELIAKGQRQLCMELHPVVLRDSANHATGVLGVARDVTARVKAERTLRKNQQFSEHIIRTTPGLIYVYDLQKRCNTYTNREILDMLGYTTADIQRMGTDMMPSLVHPDDFSVVDQHHASFATAADGEVRHLEYRMRNAQGQWVWLHSRDTVFTRDQQGAPVSILGTAEDITPRKESEQQLRQAATMSAIGRLAGGLAHDFNNILAIIQGYADLLKRSLEGSDPRLEDVEGIRTASQRAAVLIKQLLALGRRQGAKPREVSFNDILAGMSAVVHSSLGKDTKLCMELADDLWPVQADPLQIERVVLNLLANARENMHTAGRLTIGTSNQGQEPEFFRRHGDIPPGQYACLSIADSGPSIHVQDHGQVFQPFFSTSADHDAGLALAACYGIVKQSGGHIFFENLPQQGNVFRVYLPRCGNMSAASSPAGTEANT